MTWTRLDDGWTDRPILEQLPYDVRWHYLTLVQFCSRTSRYDGLVRAADARRCSDVPEPEQALKWLNDVGLLAYDGGQYRVVNIEEHIPPPSMRDERRKERQRDDKRRSRLHRAGNHTECIPGHCPHVSTDVRLTSTGPATESAPEPESDRLSHAHSAPVTTEVSTDTGTGRDGTVRDWQRESEVTVRDNESHPAAPDPDLPHRCKSCSTAIRHRNALCKPCSDAVIAANSSLQSESRPDKSEPSPDGDDDAEFLHAG